MGKKKNQDKWEWWDQWKGDSILNIITKTEELWSIPINLEILLFPNFKYDLWGYKAYSEWENFICLYYFSFFYKMFSKQRHL